VARRAIVTLWGTGVGAAIFAGGALYGGVASSAGEWGHASIAVGGKGCRCGAAGCLEAYIGAEGLLEEWRKADPLAPLPADLNDEDWVDELLARADDNAAPRSLSGRRSTSASRRRTSRTCSTPNGSSSADGLA
jgi:predicted NBD/HSP70 family sugar kinase